MSVGGENVIQGPYAGDGVSDAFTYPNYFIDPQHLIVTLIDTTGAMTTQQYGSDYTVTGTKDARLGTYAAGGTVVMTAPPPTGWQLVIARRTPRTQIAVLPGGGALPAASLEVIQDRMVLILQEWMSDYLGVLDAPPTKGSFTVGMFFRLRVPTPGGFAFYMCTTAGSDTAAVWMGMGPISTTPFPGA